MGFANWLLFPCALKRCLRVSTFDSSTPNLWCGHNKIFSAWAAQSAHCTLKCMLYTEDLLDTRVNFVDLNIFSLCSFFFFPRAFLPRLGLSELFDWAASRHWDCFYTGQSPDVQSPKAKSMFVPHNYYVFETTMFIDTPFWLISLDFQEFLAKLIGKRWRQHLQHTAFRNTWSGSYNWSITITVDKYTQTLQRAVNSTFTVE